MWSQCDWMLKHQLVGFCVGSVWHGLRLCKVFVGSWIWCFSAEFVGLNASMVGYVGESWWEGNWGYGFVFCRAAIGAVGANCRAFVRSVRKGGLNVAAGGDLAGRRGGFPGWSHSEAAVVSDGVVCGQGVSVCGCSCRCGGVYQGSILHSPSLADSCALHSHWALWGMLFSKWVLLFVSVIAFYFVCSNRPSSASEFIRASIYSFLVLILLNTCFWWHSLEDAVWWELRLQLVQFMCTSDFGNQSGISLILTSCADIVS